MRNFKEVFLILLIVVLGSALRLYKLDQIPSGFYVDEAAIGYNSWSLLETGKDEFGKSFPIVLRSFGTFPPSLYAYLTMLPIWAFGVNVFSVRLVSSISGVLLIIITYFILKKLDIFQYKVTPILGALLFAITPWTIFFSRGILEPNLGFLFIASSILFFILAGKNGKWCLAAGIALALSTYAYPSARLTSYILFAGFLLLLPKTKKTVTVISILLFLIVQIPLLSISTTPAFTTRAQGLFYKETIESSASKISFLPKIISLPIAFSREFSSQFIAYLSPRNLFFDPDPDPQRSIPQLSSFYFWLVIPYLVGVFYIVHRFKEKQIQYVFLILIAAILPAALTKDPFSTSRALPLVLPITIIILLGLEKFKKLWLISGIFLIPFSLLLLWRSYFAFLPYERAEAWSYGFEQLANEIKNRPNDKFLIDQTRIKPAYIELAFFLKYPPASLQEKIDQDIRNNYYNSASFNNHYTFENVETRNIAWEEDIFKDQILVGDTLTISEQQTKEHFLEKVFEIRDPLSQIVFQGWQTNPAKKCKAIQDKSEFCR